MNKKMRKSYIEFSKHLLLVNMPIFKSAAFSLLLVVMCLTAINTFTI